MNFKQRLFSSIIALAFFTAGASCALAQESFEKEPLTIVHQDGKRSELTAELALTASQRSQGLMYRRSMPSDEGMLFDFFEDRLVTMWMRNTYLPLDMIFAQKDGIISHIHKGAVPQDESIISSQTPVRFVLELNAGAVERRNIRVGDKLVSSQISKATQ